MQAIKSAEIATFTKQEKVQYKENLKYYRDLKNSFDTAFEEGEIKKSKQVAINLTSKGFDNLFIAEITNLTIEEIEEIRKNIEL
ncbi:MAG: hypothetical protein EAZ31_08645 [Cytophagia bacterium]|nr:MAG: hypothetical protein EAZ31_08645 [Cytophagia bacterium]